MVIMPLYNSKRTMSEAIESILKQSYKNLRLIIVDDASTDGSYELAQQYAKSPRVFLLRTSQNRGAYYSRNAGLDFIKNFVWGYFTTHDADDVSFEHRYLDAVRLLKKPRVVAVQDTFERIDLASRQSLGDNLTMAHAVFKRSVFQSLGYFETVKFGADWEYWHRLNAFNSVHRQKTSSINYTVGKSYIHDRNLTTTIPLNSVHRRRYIKQTMKEVQRMSAANNWYRPFVLDKEITKVYP